MTPIGTKVFLRPHASFPGTGPVIVEKCQMTLAGAPFCNDDCRIEIWYHPSQEREVMRGVEAGIREGVLRGPVITLPEEPLSIPEDS